MAQERLEKIRQVISGRRVLVLVHNNPDPDAIAAGWALSFILKKKFRVGSLLVYGGRILRAENRAMIRLLRIGIKPFEKIDLQRFKVVALIDTQPGTGNNSLPRSMRPSIVIDHHPLRKRTLRSPYVDVRPHYGSTATIMTEYLAEAGLPLTKRMATALYYGIKADTQNLGRDVAEADDRAATALYGNVQLRKLSLIEHPVLPRAYFLELDKAIHTSRIYDNLVVADMGFLSNPDMVGLISDLLVRMSGIRWTLVTGRDDSQFVFSLRTNRWNENAGRMAQRLAKGLGTAGGHGMVAGGQIPTTGSPFRKEEEIRETLEGRLLRYLGREKAREEQLILS